MSDSRSRSAVAKAAVAHAAAEDDAAPLGFLLLTTVVFALAGGCAALWSGASLGLAFLAYMAGGWTGLALAALMLWRRGAD